MSAKDGENGVRVAEAQLVLGWCSSFWILLIGGA